MSRSPSSPTFVEAPSPLKGVVRALLVGPWHAACMCLCTGCLYTAPVWRPEVNLSPEIIRPEEADVREIPIVFTTAQVLVTVIASDPEGEALEFVWQTPTADPVVTTYAQGDDAWVSVLTLLEGDVEDGDTVRVTVLDNNPRGAVDVVWRVEVP